MEEVDVCNSWEDIDPTALEKRLEMINIEKKRDQTGETQTFKILTRQQDPRNDNLSHVQLDDTSQESLRSQYVPPEPKISILSRPKARPGASNSQQLNGHSSNKNKPVKSLQQREQEYAEARMRILGNVKFEDSDDCEPEEDAATYAGLTPAEILKQKIAQVLLEDNPSGSPGTTQEPPSLPPTKANASAAPTTAPATAPASKSSKKSKREKIKTTNPEPTRDFPVSKTDMERIIRQPRGPDGTSGFNFQR